MVAVALPKLARAFGIGRGHAGVLITVYLAAMLIGQPIAGRVSDAFGTKRVVMTSLVGFAACSTGAALSPTFAWLVAARGLQAVFASALAPSVQSMLRSLTPEQERGHSFGILGSVIGVGAAAGPILGGLLVTVFGWRSIFLANLPLTAIAFGILSTVNSRNNLHHHPEQTGPDQPSPEQPSPQYVPILNTNDPKVRGQGTLLDTPTPSRLMTKISREKRWRKTDLVEPAYLAAVAAQSLSNLAQYSLLLIAPIVLDARGWNSGKTGFALSALTIGMIVISPAGGRYGDRAGPQRALVIGFCVAGFATALLLPFNGSVPPALLIAVLALFGLGLGLASPSILAAGLGAVPSHRSGAAAGILSASRYVGSIVAALMISTSVADNGSGARILYIAAASALVLAVGAASKISPNVPPNKNARRTNR
jgi:MFS family permease